MNRSTFQNQDLTLSYLDAGGHLPPLLALHAHWMEGAAFSTLAKDLGSQWRVIAPDQRGHGHSDRAPTFTREDYRSDLEALFQHLGLKDAVLLGNSLGGVNAYQFAAHHPHRVRALVIEDVGVEIPADLPPIMHWAGNFPSREELEFRVGARMMPYIEDSIRHTEAGWHLAFEPRDMIASQKELAGDRWSDWLATDCPALVIRGADSRVTTAEHLAQMADRRPNTRLITLEGGHVVHKDNPTAFAAAVSSFLESAL